MNENWQTEVLFTDASGYEIKHHMGDGAKSVDWHATVNHGSSIEVCLNHSGRAEVFVQGVRMILNNERVGIYDSTTGKLKTRRNRGYDHKFTTITLQKEYLQDQLAPSQFFLKPSIRQAIFDNNPTLPLCKGRDLSSFDREWLNNTSINNHIPDSGRQLWMQSKIMEFVACNFFKREIPETELFCHQVKRNNSDRITRTKLYLESHYHTPFSLENLAHEIGCSSSYLSRLFSKETGITIKNYLRSVRIRHARKLLKSGTHNVTEAAYDCGYNSLSHFAKAFQEELGYKPSDLKI